MSSELRIHSPDLKRAGPDESAWGSIRLLGNRKMQYFISFILFRAFGLAT